MPRFLTTQLVTLSLTLAATSPLSAQNQATLRLTTIATYGSTDPRTELGSVNGVVETRDGQVVVLDGLNKKVVVFDRQGGFVRAFGREGEVMGAPSRNSSSPWYRP